MRKILWQIAGCAALVGIGVLVAHADEAPVEDLNNQNAQTVVVGNSNNPGTTTNEGAFRGTQYGNSYNLSLIHI